MVINEDKLPSVSFILILIYMFKGQFVYTDARDALLARILETAAGVRRIKD
jgi:hypothetical protein